jgi:hypothetical protein
MRKFDETMNYLNTLWESIFNPKLSMGSDFAESYNNINERVEALANLDYGKLLDESLDSSIKTYLAKDKILQRNPQVLTQGGWRSVFEPEWATIEQSYKTLLDNFKECAIKLEQSGAWSKQESLQYRTTLSMFLEILEVKYHDFRDLHKDLISGKVPNEGYTVMQWAIILHYINAEKYPNKESDNQMIRQFMKDFNIQYSYNNIRNKFYDFKSRLENTQEDFNQNKKRNKGVLTKHTIRAMKAVLPKIKKLSLEGFDDAVLNIRNVEDLLG